jgi:transposase
MDTERKPTYEELEAEVVLLRKSNAELEQEVVDLKAQVAEFKVQIDKLTKMLFGRKSEKSKKKDDDDSLQPPSAQVVAEKKKRKRGGGGRKPFPANIPRRDVHVALAPEECRCANCGKDFVPMGVEISEVLNYIPMVLEVIRFIRTRMKRACDCPGEKIVIAEVPIRTIDKGLVTTEFIAAMLVNKYCDHLPIHRQARRLFKSARIGIAESSVCRWRDQVAGQVEGIAKLMKSKMMQSHCINTDATKAPCRLPKEGHRQVNGNMYVYIGGNDRPYHVFDFYPNQSAIPIYKFLKGYSGIVQCDAHGNYDSLFAPKIPDPNHPPPKECGCHAHCRRNFKDSEKTEPDRAKQFLNLYKKLYKIEAETHDATPDERRERRQRDSIPILDTLFDLCRECSNDSTILPKSPLGQACAYALKNETALRFYCTDGRLNIDNNVSERTLREPVVGRKNWLFFGSPTAAKHAATIMSVLSSAQRHGLNEYEYLVDILYRLSDWNPLLDPLENLLPDRWTKSPTPATEAAALIENR